MTQALDKIVNKIVTVHGLKEPDEIRRLRDRQIFGVPGVGNVALVKIREAFPLDEVAALKWELNALRAKTEEFQQLLQQAINRPMPIATLYGVAAVKVTINHTLIRLSGFRDIIMIATLWDTTQDEAKRFIDQGFGEMPNTGHVLGDQPLLNLRLLQSIMIEKARLYEHFWSRNLVFKTGQGTYRFNLFGSPKSDIWSIAKRNPSIQPRILDDRWFPPI